MSLFASPSIPQSASERSFTFQSVSRTKGKSEDPASVLEWASQNPIISIKKEESSQGHSNKDIQVIRFGLSEKSAPYYSLLRGMAGVGHPQEVFLKANKEDKDFTLSFVPSVETEALGYLSKVLQIIEEELRFKQVLRKVIINQEKFRLEEKLLFNELSSGH